MASYSGRKLNTNCQPIGLSTNYYQFLGVGVSASKDEIRRSFLSKARQLHPDKNSGQPGSEDMMKYLNKAYDTLSDKEKRADYDESLLDDTSATDLLVTNQNLL